ncbi:MAG: c-type cytochrome domain-containing protein, partial [Opitutae bacterium]
MGAISCLSLFGFTAMAEEQSFFESKIRPVLAQKCYECHSAQAKKIKGGLRLDHISLIKQGGDSGSAIESID